MFGVVPMSVTVDDGQDLPEDTGALRLLAETVLRRERYPDGTAVSVMLVTDEVIADHNLRHMGRRGPTDVLAFPLEHLEPGRPPSPPEGGPPLMLGDVLVAPATVRAQAAELGVDGTAELSLMVVHGILHLMGYDHVDEEDAEAMERREREILAEMGMVRS